MRPKNPQNLNPIEHGLFRGHSRIADGGHGAKRPPPP